MYIPCRTCNIYRGQHVYTVGNMWYIPWIRIIYLGQHIARRYPRYILCTHGIHPRYIMCCTRYTPTVHVISLGEHTVGNTLYTVGIYRGCGTYTVCNTMFCLGILSQDVTHGIYYAHTVYTLCHPRYLKCHPRYMSPTV